MSDTQGFELNPLLWRLHDGLREFQSWRNNRRQRDADAGQPEPVVAATPSVHDAVNAGGMPGAGLEPQGFVSYGGRLVPLFGEIQPAASAAVPAPPSAAKVVDLFAPPPPPASETKRDPEPSRLATAKPLTLPAPTPPPCLNLRPQTTPPPDTGDAATASSTPRRPDSEEASTTTAKAEEVHRLRTEAEVQRLEQAQMEHRVLLAALLDEHRETLRAQAEAAAAKQDQIVRELLAEHRAELGKAFAAHSEHIRELLAEHREQAQRTIETADSAMQRHAASVAELAQVLAKQVEVQARDHEQTTQHLDNLSSFIGDLTQTISLLAMATYTGKPEVGASPAPTSAALPTLLPPTAALEQPTLAVPAEKEPAPDSAPTIPCAATPQSPTTRGPAIAGPLRISQPEPCPDSHQPHIDADQSIHDCDEGDKLLRAPDMSPRRFPLTAIVPLGANADSRSRSAAGSSG